MHHAMARPRRSSDEQLAELVQEHLKGAPGGDVVSIRSLARELGIQGSTLSRSLREQAFSRELAGRLRKRLGSAEVKQTNNQAVLKALQLLSRADRLRARAEKLLRTALDLPDQAQ